MFKSTTISVKPDLIFKQTPRLKRSHECEDHTVLMRRRTIFMRYRTILMKFSTILMRS